MEPVDRAPTAGNVEEQSVRELEVSSDAVGDGTTECTDRSWSHGTLAGTSRTEAHMSSVSSDSVADEAAGRWDAGAATAIATTKRSSEGETHDFTVLEQKEFGGESDSGTDASSRVLSPKHAERMLVRNA